MIVRHSRRDRLVLVVVAVVAGLASLATGGQQTSESTRLPGPRVKVSNEQPTVIVPVAFSRRAPAATDGEVVITISGGAIWEGDGPTPQVERRALDAEGREIEEPCRGEHCLGIELVSFTLLDEAPGEVALYWSVSAAVDYGRPIDPDPALGIDVTIGDPG